MYHAITDRIIIRLDKTAEAEIILNCTGENRNRGRVVDVGANVRSVKKGDHVIFHVYDELPLPEDDLVIIREKSLLGILPD